MNMPDLQGKYVLVTGAAGGIGRAAALAFADLGAHLLLADLTLESLRTVSSSVALRGVQCHAFAVDVSSEQAMRQFAGQVHQLTPAVDVLINNAGVAYIGPFLDSPLSSWTRIFDINLMGVVHGCHFFLPRMRAAGGRRHVLNVASLAGIAPAPNMSAYAASKHAVMGLSEVLAMELDGGNVAVSTICPGIINTDITKGPRASSVSDHQISQLQAYYREFGAEPEVVAAAMVKAVRSGRELVLVGPFAQPMYHLKRLSRALVRRLTLSNARKSNFI